jgi:hypothetical protein
MLFLSTSNLFIVSKLDFLLTFTPLQASKTNGKADAQDDMGDVPGYYKGQELYILAIHPTTGKPVQAGTCKVVDGESYKGMTGPTGGVLGTYAFVRSHMHHC